MKIKNRKQKNVKTDLKAISKGLMFFDTLKNNSNRKEQENNQNSDNQFDQFFNQNNKE